ncbi:hypothetical protein CCOS865_00874 [Pseudomonas reidholzensis]|uniref:Type 4 fimbrial biogenesis protein PilX N-terminal domain-containing protein n=1 Tax=Pseudomonas reidholzensis TaxID=1785162 RepID=A0A383RNK2_9PSED|nr:hypothetical protein [Pseudomonas reidholzensis]SYX88639.1 hypothetical protein CCOS865_00874 [Pseudomonas reidholzensis]
MKPQRGMVLLIALVLSLLLGLLAASALTEALLQTRMASLLLANAQALEQAEATLHAGAAQLALAPPVACQHCLPPDDPHALGGQQGAWQATADGWFLLQNLGASSQAAHVPEGTPVTLYRVTAVSQQVRARHVLEAVYAVQPHQPPQRILWRQRVQEP